MSSTNQFVLPPGLIGSAQTAANEIACQKRLNEVVERSKSLLNNQKRLSDELGYPQDGLDVRVQFFQKMTSDMATIKAKNDELNAFLQREQRAYEHIVVADNSVFEDFASRIPTPTVMLLLRLTVSMCRNVDNIRQLGEEHKRILCNQELENLRIQDSQEGHHQQDAASQSLEVAHAAQVGSLESEVRLLKERQAADAKEAKTLKVSHSALEARLTTLQAEATRERSRADELDKGLLEAQAKIRDLEQGETAVQQLTETLEQDAAARNVLQRALRTEVGLVDSDLSDDDDGNHDGAWYDRLARKFEKRILLAKDRAVEAAAAEANAKRESRKLQREFDRANFDAERCRREKASLQTDIEHAHKLLEERRNAESAALDEVLALKREVNNLRETLRGQEHSCSMAKKAAAGSLEREQKALDDITKAYGEMERLSTEKMELENELSRTRLASQRDQARDLGLPRKLEAVTRSRDELSKSLEDAEANAKIREDQLMSRISTLEQEQASLSSKLDEEASKKQEGSALLTSVTQERDELQQTLADTNSSMDLLRQEFKEEQQKLFDADASIAAKTSTIDLLKSEKDFLAQSLASSAVSRSEVQGSLECMTRTRDNLQACLDEEREKVRRQTKDLGDAHEQLKKADCVADAKSQEVDALRMKCDKLEGELRQSRDNLQACLDEEREKVRRQTKDLGDAREQLKKADCVAEAKSQEVDALRMKCDKLEGELRQSTEQVGHWKQRSHAEQGLCAKVRSAFEHVLSQLSLRDGSAVAGLIEALHVEESLAAEPCKGQAWVILPLWDPSVVNVEPTRCRNVLHATIAFWAQVSSGKLSDPAGIDSLNNLTSSITSCSSVSAGLLCRLVKSLVAVVDGIDAGPKSELAYPAVLGLLQLTEICGMRWPEKAAEVDPAAAHVEKWLTAHPFAKVLKGVVDGDLSTACHFFDEVGLYTEKAARYCLGFVDRGDCKTIRCIARDNWDVVGRDIRLHGPADLEPIKLRWQTKDDLDWWMANMEKPVRRNRSAQ